MDMVKTKNNLPEKSSDVPVTVGMLHVVRDELRSDIRSLEYKMDSRFKDVDSQFKQVDARFEQIDARFEQIDAQFEQIDARFKQMDSRFDQMDLRFDAMASRIDSRFSDMDSRLEKMLSRMYQMHSLAEEQNARNKVVMDGLNFLFDRQDRCETRINEVEKTVSELGSVK